MDSSVSSGGIRFKINKGAIKKERGLLKESFFGTENQDDGKIEGEEGELIGGIFDGDVEYVKQTEKKGPPVIKLIEYNKWHSQAQNEKNQESSSSSEYKSKSPEPKAQEIIKPDLGQNNKTPGKLEISTKYGLIVPPKRHKPKENVTVENSANSVTVLMKRNAVPGIENIKDSDKRYSHDIKHRPENTTGEDYERVSISEFGAAMLRGMGWEESKLVDKNHKTSGDLYLPETRPHLLGLGAKPIPEHLSKNVKKSGG